MIRTFLLGVLAVLVVAWSAPVVAQEMVTVRITNVSKQIISPPLVATHSWKARVFIPGRAASSELSMLAEDGDPSALAALLGDSDEVLDMKVADGPLLPGATLDFELEARGRYNRVSAIGMLVTTNDAFYGVESLSLSNSQRVNRFTVPAYDAGSEANNESCAFIPGPPCGNGGVRATAGAEGYIHVHRGIHGVGDLPSIGYDWRNPVARISVIREGI